MTQTVIAIAAGRELDEHENPGEATLHVIQGRVELRSRATTVQGDAGHLLVVPQSRHSVYAVTHAVVLLTACKRHSGNIDADAARPPAGSVAP